MPAAKTTSTKTTSAKTAATAADLPQHEATAAHLDAARTAHQDAEAARDDLDARLAAGDATVTAAALVESDAEIRRTAVLLTHAEGAHRDAEGAHRIAVAVQTATALAGGSGLDDLGAAADGAYAAVTSALGVLRSTVRARNDAIAKAAAAAEDVGLIAGSADPLSPVLVAHSVEHGGKVLVVGGVAQPVHIDADALAAKVLARAGDEL